MNLFSVATKVAPLPQRNVGTTTPTPGSGSNHLFYIESYGCQMNLNDSEIVASILQKEGWAVTLQIEDANLILVNTCSIREKAENTVRKRLTEFKKLKIKNRRLLIGLLGCMAERLKKQLLDEEALLDIVVGPDSYRALPALIKEATGGQKAVNVLLSREETYADIAPVRLQTNGISAFISIMRGCNNMCSFCVVPFTRGRERSRDINSILNEAQKLFQEGFREVVLLGQNVDSYNWHDDTKNESVSFAKLLEQVALIHPLLRVRFSTSHPKDISNEVLQTIAQYPNICKCIHLPLQSGSTRILDLMNRNYTREWYIEKVNAIRSVIPNCSITTDIITGFCTEMEADHAATLAMMETCRYDFSYMFAYSERANTPAHKHYADDIHNDIKIKRLQEIIALQNQLSKQSNERDVNQIFEVLVEGDSKKDTNAWVGRSSQNKVVVFPKANATITKGSYAKVVIERCTQGTLIGKAIR